MSDNKRTVDHLNDMVLTKKPKPSLQMTFNFYKPAALQNTLNVHGWKVGDPNDETSPEYDMVWLIWILRNVFPKDIVTYFMNLNGGFNFTLYRSPINSAGYSENVELKLTMWKDIYSHVTQSQWRNIYFNIPLQKIERKKNRVYVWHSRGKSFYIHE